MNSEKAKELATEFAAAFGGNGMTTDQQIAMVADRLMQFGPSGTEGAVCRDIEQRQKFGLKKYGMTVRDNPLPLKAWLNHAYEEALDSAVYLKRAMEEIE